ncbi:Omp85 family outer membrane protein [Geofilum sp. OHC36d9]|uniref:Omp85 family outer membrane protein n=1 Tax=Geofilum sp. OHC36d9 TaxID=3458413 RepID=UPI004033E72E
MKQFVITTFLGCLLFVTVKGQSDSLSTNKTGWNFGVLPAVSFDADLGFQYGGLINLYEYGDGSRFPLYNHSLYFEISHYTKGSGIFRFYYDSDRLFKGLRVTTDLTYMPEQAYDFYGFNGYESVYNKVWEDDENDETDGYRTRMFYKMKQNMFRFKTDFQGAIGHKGWQWIAGINMLNFDIGSVDIDKLNKGQDEVDKLPQVEEQPGLYERYVDWGLIDDQEANGGFIPELKAGFVYDTRDNRPNPMQGVWTEAVLVAVPEFLGAESGFTRLAVTHRQYFTLIPEDLSLAFRVGWQQTLSGHVPFYYQSQVVTSVMTGATSTGLGGSRTLRGIRRNRVVGDGMLFGNLEARWKAVHFNFINQNFYLGINTFMDAGRTTALIDVKKKVMSINEPMDDYFDFGAETWHLSYGLGLRIAMNRNFIVAADYGRAANKQDGESGFYIGLNYLF